MQLRKISPVVLIISLLISYLPVMAAPAIRRKVFRFFEKPPKRLLRRLKKRYRRLFQFKSKKQSR